MAPVGDQAGTHPHILIQASLGSLPSPSTQEGAAEKLPRVGEHCGHPMTRSNSAGVCTFLPFQVSFYHYRFHYFESSESLQDLSFFQASYKKDFGITVPMLTIALLKAAAEKQGALDRIKT